MSDDETGKPAPPSKAELREQRAAEREARRQYNREQWRLHAEERRAAFRAGGDAAAPAPPALPAAVEPVAAAPAAVPEVKGKPTKAGGVVGLESAEWLALVQRIELPPGDAQGNAKWANKTATLLTYFTAVSGSLSPALERKIVQIRKGIAQTGSTAPKAIMSESIEALQRAAGLTKNKATDDARLVPIDRGRAIRAAGRIQRGQAVSRPLPELPPETDG